jgi:adenylate cyclase
MFLGRRGWRGDLEEGIALARLVDAAAWPFVQLYKYAAAVGNGAVLPGARDVVETVESLEVAERSGNNTAVAYATLSRAITLIHNDFEDSSAGLELLAKAREMVVGEQLTVALRRLSDIELARERARSRDLSGAIDLPQRFSPSSSTPAKWSSAGPPPRCWSRRCCRAVPPPTRPT